MTLASTHFPSNVFRVQPDDASTPFIVIPLLMFASLCLRFDVRIKKETKNSCQNPSSGKMNGDGDIGGLEKRGKFTCLGGVEWG